MFHPDQHSANGLRVSFALVLAASLTLVLCGFVVGIDGDALPIRYFRSQDLPVLAFALAWFFVAGFLMRRFAPYPRLDLPQTRVVLGLAFAFALALWWGSYVVMSDYPLTRDEHMVLFDMAIFGRGELVAPLDPFWRGHARALVPDFLLTIPGQPVLVSAYLPGNAMLRAIFDKIADPALMNPLLAMVAVIALLDIARRLFPNDRPAQGVALLLLVSSAQFIVNAMTAYAMTAHLAANLCWLSLFLRGGRWGHAGALVVGFIAIGLHQIVFHPLFVAPFLMWRWREGGRGIVLLYCIVYGLSGLFWINWQTLITQLSGIEATGGAAAGAGGFIRQRVLPLLFGHSPLTFVYMNFNLARFFAWQNLALLPLLMGAGHVLLRGEGLARPLAGGLCLAVVAFAFLLPYQGHGWGYRYLHGFLGSAALLGAYGYRALVRRQAGPSCGFVLGSTILTLLVVLPFLLFRAHDFVAPNARADALLGRIDADYVVIETQTGGYEVDLVRNPADLSRRPIRLASHHVEAALLESLCSKGSVVFVGRSALARLGVNTGVVLPTPRFLALRRGVAGKPCVKAPPAWQ